MKLIGNGLIWAGLFIYAPTFAAAYLAVVIVYRLFVMERPT